jgi:hypothetical protein
LVRGVPLLERRQNMARRSLPLLLAVVALAITPICASAITGLSLGVRGGSSDYSGDVIAANGLWPASGDLGSGTMLGVHINASTLPIIDLELAAEYFEKDFDYALPVIGATTLTFRDLAVRATVKYGVFAPPLSPVAVYIGAGAGMDFLNTAYPEDISLTDDQKENLLEDAAKISYHGLAGVKLSLPVVPFMIFAEGRYAMIQADETLKNLSIYGGLSLKLP